MTLLGNRIVGIAYEGVANGAQNIFEDLGSITVSCLESAVGEA